MTHHHDFKKLVRARMAVTGENYTRARSALLAEKQTDPSALRPDACPPSSPGHVLAQMPEREHPSVVEPDPAVARAEHERLIGPFLRDGRIVQVPSKRRPRFALLLELLARFAPAEDYREHEVNDVLGAVHDDVAFWRRELVDYGLLEREPGAAVYRVARALPDRSGNMEQEQTDWERVWLPSFLGGRLADGL